MIMIRNDNDGNDDDGNDNDGNDNDGNDTYHYKASSAHVQLRSQSSTYIDNDDDSNDIDVILMMLIDL